MTDLTIDKPEYKVLNKTLIVTRRTKESAWQVEANIFEIVKAYCIWDAKESSVNYLPRFLPYIDENVFPDLVAWREAFTSDNSPQKVSFKGKDQELAHEITNVDFSKPYDEATATKIRKKFEVSARKAANVDTDLIIQGELGELPEQQSEYTETK